MKQKMIELMLEVDCVCRPGECEECDEVNCFIHRAADNLIANSVTVLTEDEARNIYTVQEIEALQNEAYDLGVDSILRHKFGLSWDDAAELRKEVARLQAATKWIPVSERLPEINMRVLVRYLDKIGNEGIDTDRCWGRLGKWVRYGDGVTHWMPLPEPPKGE